MFPISSPTQPKRIINWPRSISWFFSSIREVRSIYIISVRRRGEKQRKGKWCIERSYEELCIEKCSALAASVRGGVEDEEPVLITVVMVFEFGYALWFLRNIRVRVILKLLLAVGIYFLTATWFQRSNYVCSRFIKVI